MLPAKQPDALQEDTAAIFQDAWKKHMTELTERQPATPLAPWSLFDGTLAVELADGTPREIELSLAFGANDRMVSLPRRKINELAQLLDIRSRRMGRGDGPVPPGSEESAYMKDVFRRVINVNQMAYQIGYGEFVFSPAMRITRLRFHDAERTKAEVSFTLGQRGGSWIYEKRDGKWVRTGASGMWIS
ncbi:MAG: hypothetical protein K2R98_05010 [Gemmataceae bacterium]|nr:hypothetical protein [Gemmataceae bacterium]